MKPSKEALDYLKQELLNAKVEDANLDANISLMRAKQEGVRLKIQAITAALADAGVKSVDVEVHKQPAAGALAFQGHPPTVTVGAPQGIREEIRAVLREQFNGLRARDVVEALKKRGYKFTGKVAPATRVSTELWRMAKAEQIEKRGPQYFPSLVK